MHIVSIFGREGRRGLAVNNPEINKVTGSALEPGRIKQTKVPERLKPFCKLITNIFMANQRTRELSPSLQADDKGCFRQVVKTKVFQLRQKGHDMKIEVEAKIKEEGTGLYCFFFK